MLHRGDDGVLRQLTAALQGLHRRHNQRLHHVGILRVALLVPSPAGIGNQVRVRAQGHAHAHGQVLLTAISASLVTSSSSRVAARARLWGVTVEPET